MRVLFVCDFFLKYAEPQMLALRAAGHDVALLCRDHAFEFNGDAAEREAALERIVSAGIAVFEVPGRVSDLTRVPALLAARRGVRRWRPDVAHAHDLYDPRLLLALGRAPLVTTIHDVDRHPGAPRLSPPERACRRLWLRRAAKFVVHGEKLRQELGRRVGLDRVAVVPHGTSVGAQALTVPADRTVLFFGRLEPYKGVRVLLEAMERVRAIRPEVGLVAAGSGPEDELLRSRPDVEFVDGYVPESGVDELYARASLVVLPYVEGSQSGVALQAVGRGIPVIVSDVGALPEVALDASYVVPPGDSAALAAAILRHADDGADVRAAVLARARAEFSWSACAEQSMLVYRSVLRAPARLQEAAA